MLSQLEINIQCKQYRNQLPGKSTTNLKRLLYPHKALIEADIEIQKRKSSVNCKTSIEGAIKKHSYGVLLT
jgi:hypothetical protein